jgi:predicted TIM-barrel fold metal-dependent hydrolase
MTVAGFHVIDCHHHVGSIASMAGLTVPGVEPGEDVAAVELRRRLAAMDDHGVDQAVVIPGHAYLRPQGVADTRTINDEIAGYRDARRDRFPAAVGIAEPLHGDAALDELTRMHDELGLAGVSFHTRFQGVATDSPLVLDLVRRAAELGLVPFVHALDGVPDEALWRAQAVARAVPDTTVVVLDPLSGVEHARQAPIIGAETPNLVFDVSLCHHLMFVESIVAAVGAERVVFGSDHYSMMPSPSHVAMLDDIVASSLPEADKAAILAGTIRRVLHLDP